MSPFVQKALKLTLKSVAVIFIVLLVSLLLLLWRLSSSPIQLNQFVPRIEQAASNLPGGLSVRLKGIGLFWNRSEREIDLRALDVELVESAGSSLVSVPEVNVSLSVFALLRGVIALSSIELTEMDVQLVRREDGTFRIFRKSGAVPVVASDGEPKDFSETFWHLLKTLASDTDPQIPLSYLKRLEIKGALEIEDRKTGFLWTAKTVESLFVGHRGEVRGDLGVTFSSPQAIADIHTDIAINMKDNNITASLEFGGIHPARLAPLDKRLAALAGLDIAFDGTIKTELTLPDRVQSLDVNIKSGAGQFSYRGFYPVPLKVNSLALQLTANLPGKTLRVSSLDILFGNVEEPLKLNLSGDAQVLENAVSLQLESRLQQLPVKQFDLYWPKAVAQGVRSWLVNNLKTGMVDSANVDLAIDIPTGSQAGLELKELKGTLAFSDLAVTYFGPFPPATAVNGSGSFDQSGFDLNVSKGLINDVRIEPGRVVISGLDNKKAAISVKTRLNGPLASVFAVLEAPPVKLNSDSVTGAVSEKLGGRIEADFNIALPLGSGLADSDIQYQARGKITDVIYNKIYRDYDLQAANLGFSVDRSELKFDGPLEFSGIPLVIDWTTSLTGAGKGHADFTINSTNISSAQISALGFDVSEYLQGSVSLKTIAKLAPGGHVTASVESDLNNAALAIPQIHWRKAIGDGGRIGLTLLAERDHLHAKDIDVEVGQVKTGGNVEFELSGPLMSLSLEHLSLTYAELTNLKLELKEGKHLRFTVQGGEVKLDPLLSADGEDTGPQEKHVAVEAKALTGQLKSRGFSFEVGDSKLDKVYINQDTFFENVHFSGRRDSMGWHEISIAGHNPFAGSTVDSGAQPAATEKLASGQFKFVYGPPEMTGTLFHLKRKTWVR